jgi:cysteinyl-tRNA synthetase
MSIHITNTLTGRKETFNPRTPGEVSMYVCGVTPYDSTHLGHARPAVVFDVIRKYLRLKGFKVKLIQNFTDVDDKIIARAAERGMEPLVLSRKYSEEYLRSMGQLGVEPADLYPKVSEHIADVIEMITTLIDKGMAYPADGDVYFDVTGFPEYGKLSNQRLDEVEAGTRFDVDERKRHAADFALWKAARPGEPAWDSPWGPGRPGWHIECSAMSLKYLGNHFDIHGGGVDLVFPHHENEIAQSEAYTGDAPFARYWLHNGLVNLNGEKMSKSLGNYLSVEDALKKYPAPLIRFYIISHHYRTPVDFTPERMDASAKGWQRLNTLLLELRASEVADAQWPGLAKVWIDPPTPPEGELGSLVLESARKLDAAMGDDFNTPKAIAALFDLVRDVRAKQASATKTELGWALGLLQEACALFGIEGQLEEAAAAPEEVNQLLDLLVELRTQARQRKDWAQADLIRGRLQELGISLEDTPDGTRWVRSSS